MTSGNTDCPLLAFVSDFEGSAARRLDRGLSELSVLPVDINRAVSSGTKAVNLALRPGLWQCRQEMYLSDVALEQHLGNAGSAAQIAVNLKDPARPAGIHQVAKRIACN